MMIIPQRTLSWQRKALGKAIAIPGNNIPGDDQPGWETATKTQEKKKKKKEASKAVEDML